MTGKRILIVDDEADFLVLMKNRLEKVGYEVSTASDGPEALEKIRREKPDAVLLDILMPQLDGLKVLKKIRSKDKKLPVFILTAFSDGERFHLAERLGASGFIVKTSDLQKEIGNITSVLRISSKYKNE